MKALKLARLPDGGPELFHTLQGEGASLGCPAVFIRLSRCNLSCTWCDTPYTWNFEDTDFQHKDGKKFKREAQTIELERAELRARLSAFPCNRLVITGGEPLLQQRALLHLLEDWRHFSQVEVETNGTIMPLEALSERVTAFNVSPKLSHSGLPESSRLKLSTLSHFATLSTASFKFVVSSPADLSEIESLVEQCHLPKERLLLMPEGRNERELQRSGVALADLCIKKGYRFSPRLHVHLWGDERGK